MENGFSAQAGSPKLRAGRSMARARKQTVKTISKKAMINTTLRNSAYTKPIDFFPFRLLR